MNYDMKYLSIPLPEDITKLKWSGFFKELQTAIQEYLQKENLPESLRKRLEIESELASRIPIQYPFSWNDAPELLVLALPEPGLPALVLPQVLPV